VHNLGPQEEPVSAPRAAEANAEIEVRLHQAKRDLREKTIVRQTYQA
jgi:hypothetical protein